MVQGVRWQKRGRKKGTKKTGGRKVGSPNIQTRIVREAFLLAAEAIGMDGKGKDGLVGFLIKQGRKYPKEFMAHLAKAMTVEVKATVAQEIVDVKYENVDELRAALKEQGLVIPDIYQLEYHDPLTLEPIDIDETS